ncbi:MAG: PleD family two-component system response regulator [Desulfitobacteriaceae bacterium]
MRRKTILICDDQDKFIKTFRDNHSQYYDISELLDIRLLMDRIKNNIPDLILLDLYHPKDDKLDFEKRRLNAELELSNLDEQIKKTKDAVDATWEPLGLEVLKDIRKKYNSRKLPVVMYSQRGLFLMDDAQVRTVEENEGHWMLKKYSSARTEKVRMDRIMDYAGKAKPVIKLYRITLISICSIFIVFLSILYLGFNPFFNILIGMISSLITYFITKFIER